ncbi:MAG: right-handed parallel beta-helix repeat-containing protein, partial [Proteobacteria bacterium]|nr:right-handed parallel beta-helix repeat-containing protein [Pseudomonadota bacterium]
MLRTALKLKSCLCGALFSALLVSSAGADVYSWDAYRAEKLPGWQPGDPVTIDGDVVHYYDSADRSSPIDEVVGALTVQNGGAFHCDDPAEYAGADPGDPNDGNTRRLTVESVTVQSASTFECGSSIQSFEGEFTLAFRESDACLTGPLPQTDPSCQGFRVMGGAELSLYGNNEGHTWTVAVETNLPDGNGDTVLKVADASGWRAGDKISIAAADFDENVFTDSTVQHREIASVDVATGTLQLTSPIARRVIGDDPYVYPNSPLKYRYGDPGVEGTLAHRYTQELGALADQHGNSLLGRILAKEGADLNQLDERTEVANKTRNIRFIGDQDPELKEDKLGVHLMFMYTAGAIQIDGLEVENGGRMGMLGRYPIHWHRHPTTLTPRNDDFIRNSSIHAAYSRCITVHGVSGLTVEHNICVDTAGHGYFLEDGDETGNRFIDNIAMLIKRPDPGKELLLSDVVGPKMVSRTLGPAGFWISNPDNIFVGNSASSAGTGFWFALKDDEHKIPGSPEPNSTPFSVFSGNSTHAVKDGLSVDNGPNGECADMPPCPDGVNQLPATVYAGSDVTGEILLDDFRAYKTTGFGAWVRSVDAKAITNMVLADNRVSIGLVLTQDATNSLVVGASPALLPDENPEPRLQAALLYDGVEGFWDLHLAGFADERGALPVAIFPQAADRPQHLSRRISNEEANARIVDLEHSLSGRADNWSTGVYDIDGSLIGITEAGDPATYAFPGYSIRPDEPGDVDAISTFFSNDPLDEDCKTPLELESLPGGAGMTDRMVNASICPGYFSLAAASFFLHVESVSRILPASNYPTVELFPAEIGDSIVKSMAFPQALIQANRDVAPLDPHSEDDLTYDIDLVDWEFYKGRRNGDDTSFELGFYMLNQNDWTPWFVLRPGNHRSCSITDLANVIEVDIGPQAIKARAQAVSPDLEFGRGLERENWYQATIYLTCGPDTDNDGILNTFESGPDDDMDGDGVVNSEDLDNDSYDANGDGDCTDEGEFGDCVPDAEDQYPDDPYEWVNTDKDVPIYGDKVPDNRDEDDDADSLLDIHETGTGEFVSKIDTGTDSKVSNRDVNSDGDRAFVDADPQCIGALGLWQGSPTYGEVPLDDLFEIQYSDVSDLNNPLVADRDADGIPDFEEGRGLV